MKINIGQTIRELREKRKLRQDELGEIIGVSGATISSWEIGRTEPNMGYTQQLADFFGVSTDKLIYGFDLFPFDRSEEDRTARNNVGGMLKVLQHKIIPILGEICAGDGIWCEENYSGHIVVDTRLRTDFALHVKGNSMSGININDRDIALFQKTPVAENGQIVAVRLLEDNTVTLKKIYYKENFVLLQPANDEYEPIITSEYEVLGWFVGIFYKEMV